MRKAAAAKISSAWDQPMPSIKTWLTGATANWPNEPPAEATPSAILRRSGLAARPTGPSTTAKPPALMPMPISTPMPICR